MKYIDLHTHSTSSDGTLTPSELVSRGAALGLSAIALTDHDNTDGLEEAMAAAAPLSIEVVPGIEFSTEYLGTDIHILGLDLDYRAPGFQRQIGFYRTERLRRNQKMIRRMADDGIDISYESMAARFGETVWTRAHFARYLAEHGYVPEMKDAFRTHIGEGCKYYVPRERVSPFPVVELILRFGGIPVLAHPLQYKFPEDTLRTLLKKLQDAGLLGMEVYYSTYSREQQDYLLRLAGDYGLLPSGGSDFHGANKPDICLGTGKGNLSIPYRILEDLRRKKKEKTTKREEDMKKFRERYLSGETDFEEIFDLTDEWNFSDETCTLREYLGLTAEEEDIWISDSDEALEDFMEKERKERH